MRLVVSVADTAELQLKLRVLFGTPALDQRMSGFISLSEVSQKVEKPFHAKYQRYLVRITRLRVLFLVSNLVDNGCDYRKR